MVYNIEPIHVETVLEMKKRHMFEHFEDLPEARFENVERLWESMQDKTTVSRQVFIDWAREYRASLVRKGKLQFDDKDLAFEYFKTLNESHFRLYYPATHRQFRLTHDIPHTKFKQWFKEYKKLNKYEEVHYEQLLAEYLEQAPKEAFHDHVAMYDDVKNCIGHVPIQYFRCEFVMVRDRRFPDDKSSWKNEVFIKYNSNNIRSTTGYYVRRLEKKRQVMELLKSADMGKPGSLYKNLKIYNKFRVSNLIFQRWLNEYKNGSYVVMDESLVQKKAKFMEFMAGVKVRKRRETYDYTRLNIYEKFDIPYILFKRWLTELD